MNSVFCDIRACSVLRNVGLHAFTTLKSVISNVSYNFIFIYVRIVYSRIILVRKFLGNSWLFEYVSGAFGTLRSAY
jgi:hypothetical protein